ncbi:hypothetical protein LZZ85_23805 [Terrimonas sp. NA20]|uniref:Uncharacterized protein n=1 Tax=Terrimonas ginsenosidimutans TaxID=2908004 RepID=A0ABS9KYF9_9BACT|nr:hypothetical protein [Terrimonas ginsenosidimutans]MCG2617343.1 hypothetical protein [Terrimonas ginsenosidimutans]
MKYIIFLAIISLAFSCISTRQAATPVAANTDTIPSLIKGDFADDYDIRYTLTDSLFTQYPQARYHILKWNTKEQYFVARNDTANPSEKGLYSRIDYMYFQNMEPWHWGFCLTVYNAPSDSLAEVQAIADRKNPRKGCNGYPFSRMKRR